MSSAPAAGRPRLSEDLKRQAVAGIAVSGALRYCSSGEIAGSARRTGSNPPDRRARSLAQEGGRPLGDSDPHRIRTARPGGRPRTGPASCRHSKRSVCLQVRPPAWRPRAGPVRPCLRPGRRDCLLLKDPGPGTWQRTAVKPSARKGSRVEFRVWRWQGSWEWLNV